MCIKCLKQKPFCLGNIVIQGCDPPQAECRHEYIIIEIEFATHGKTFFEVVNRLDGLSSQERIPPEVEETFQGTSAVAQVTKDLQACLFVLESKVIGCLPGGNPVCRDDAPLLQPCAAGARLGRDASDS